MGCYRETSQILQNTVNIENFAEPSNDISFTNIPSNENNHTKEKKYTIWDAIEGISQIMKNVNIENVAENAIHNSSSNSTLNDDNRTLEKMKIPLNGTLQRIYHKFYIILKIQKI